MEESLQSLEQSFADAASELRLLQEPPSKKYNSECEKKGIAIREWPIGDIISVLTAIGFGILHTISIRYNTALGNASNMERDIHIACIYLYTK